MAGHSKWKQIKRKKAITDAKRASSWTKVIREITVAARAGGGDPAGNPRLRTAIDAAKAVNMPGENIDRGIKKGTGELEGQRLRGADLRRLRAWRRGHLHRGHHGQSRTEPWPRSGTRSAETAATWEPPTRWPGCSTARGRSISQRSRHDEDTALEAALDSGAEDFSREGDQYLVTTTPSMFHAVQDALRGRGFEIESAELAMVPRNTVRVEGADAERIVRLMDVLEELDDVSKVFSNFDIDAAQLAEAEA